MKDLSDKNKTNRKWVSTDKYRESYKKIFEDSKEGSEPKNEQENTEDSK